MVRSIAAAVGLIFTLQAHAVTWPELMLLKQKNDSAARMYVLGMGHAFMVANASLNRQGFMCPPSSLEVTGTDNWAMLESFVERHKDTPATNTTDLEVLMLLAFKDKFPCKKR
jgi:hypothetical protein